MNINDFKSFIVVPTLKIAGLYSPAAANLMVGTAVTESDLEYLEQRGPGRAMGFFQIEEATYNDILRYLNRYSNARLKEAVLAVAFYDGWPPVEALIHNMRWGCIVGRLKYYMQKEKLPEAYDAEGLSSYYKRYYNTAKGKAEYPRIKAAFDIVINLKPD